MVIPFNQLLNKENLPEKKNDIVLVSAEGLPEGYSNNPAWQPLAKDYEKFRGKLPEDQSIAMVIKVKPKKIKFIDVVNRRSTESPYGYITAVTNLQKEIGAGA
jgi:hypothetical protein